MTRGVGPLIPAPPGQTPADPNQAIEHCDLTPSWTSHWPTFAPYMQSKPLHFFIAEWGQQLYGVNWFRHGETDTPLCHVCWKYDLQRSTD